MTERSGKTGHVTLGVWFDEEAGDIHLTIPGHGFSTVSNNRDHARGNPHLYNKLAKALRDLGKPHPAIIEEWGGGGELACHSPTGDQKWPVHLSAQLVRGTSEY